MPTYYDCSRHIHFLISRGEYGARMAIKPRKRGNAPGKVSEPIDTSAPTVGAGPMTPVQALAAHLLRRFASPEGEREIRRIADRLTSNTM